MAKAIAKNVIKPMPCLDGCGILAKAGSSYLPGHDAKLASMLQKFSDGLITELPALVKTLIKTKKVVVPAPRFLTVELRVTILVQVPADTTSKVVDAKLVVEKRLDVKAVTITGDIEAVRPSTKE
jgi:hypothetical protein